MLKLHRLTTRRALEEVGKNGALRARPPPFAPLRRGDDETHVNSRQQHRCLHHRYRRRRHHHGAATTTRHRRRYRRRMKSVRPECTTREGRGSLPRVRPAVPACGTRARASARFARSRQSKLERLHRGKKKKEKR
ncbi:hypothetical protein PUN28_016678 [Cardiocondyla obscurior]|uniref:Uncharacterized protein n=1 Tax=Cardiocondyla obscurior TaxID=286306 RepID=A0AAW2EN72_9HYME